MDVAVWSEKLSPGQNKVTPLADLQLHNVALSETLEDPSERTVVKMTYMRPVPGDGDDDDEEEDVGTFAPTTTVICSLTAGKIEQYSCRLGLFDSEEYVFEVVGKNTVYLTGNYVTFSNGSDVDGDSDDEEDEFDLRDVSSDVEIDMDPAEVDSDASRFEEVEDEHPKGSKRPRDSDVNTDGAESKADKKAQKKMKNQDGQAVPTKADDELKKKDKKEKKDKGEKKVREIAGGIKIKDAKTGSGPQAKKGNTVSMRYVGKLENGKVFDQNTKGKPFTFKLGKGEVIKGWDEGIVGMQVGGERSLTIPPQMAYGKRSQAGIPANSTLIFDVKLLDIK